MEIIICFRDLKKATDDALALFGDNEVSSIVLLKSYKDYYFGYDENGKHNMGYTELIENLENEFPLGEEITGEEKTKNFIKLYGKILKIKNILSAFDDFAGKEILSERDFQDYQSKYIDFYQDFHKKEKSEKENIMNDIVFEIELVKQIEVNIDYILMLVEKYHDSNCEDKEILTKIDKAIDSSLKLRSKKELIEDFIKRVNLETKVTEDWHNFVKEKKEEEINKLIKEENLNQKETKTFIDNSFRDGEIKVTGRRIDEILPPLSRFQGTEVRKKKKQSVIEKLKKFFEKYFGAG
jgi:type I restriction enzyme R subunit